MNLFTPEETGLAQASEHWLLTKDGDPHALDLYLRHYSGRRYRRNFYGGREGSSWKNMANLPRRKLEQAFYAGALEVVMTANPTEETLRQYRVRQYRHKQE